MNNIKMKHIFFATFITFSVANTPLYADSQQVTVKKLTADFNEMCTKQEFSGVVLIASDDKILFEKACGLAHRGFNVPNTIQTKFNLGSVGKLFTSVGIAQLAQQNKFSLSDPVNKYLPSWLPQPTAEKITIEDLLIHASGLGSFMDDGRWKLGSDSGLYNKTNDYRLLIQDDKLFFTPGASQSYSNNGYVLLGALIESIAGMDYADYLTKYIFSPLGMKNTGLYRLDDPIENRAEGYFSVCKEGKCRWKNNNFAAPFVGSPAGGAYSTVDDLFLFSKALHQGTLLNSDYTRDILSAKIVRVSKDITTKTINIHDLAIPEQMSPYGFAGAWNTFGFAVWESPILIGHTGGISGASAFFATSTDGKYTIIILSNMSGSGPIKYYKKVKAALGFSEQISNY